jgi:hypothetical protein
LLINYAITMMHFVYISVHNASTKKWNKTI